MWWTVVLYVAPVLLQHSNAQLTSPSEPVCPGNRVIFTCQQPGAITRWMIRLPSVTLQNTAQSSQTGSFLLFVNDPGFNFELHTVSYSSNILATELQVTAVRELNGVTVECAGSSGTLMSTIRVASVDLPAAPSGVMAFNKQFTKTGASVTVTWSTSRGADNYTVHVTPPIMPGQLSDFTTTDSSLLLMLVYNVNYTINITAKNCAGSNSTVLPLTIGGCSPPSSPTNGSINEYHNGTVGASLTFQCNTGYIPHEQVTSTCMENGTWIPIPQCMLADCGSPSVSSDRGVVIEPFDNTLFNATIVFHCEEGLIPNATIEAVCGRTGVWSPNPANHIICVNESSAYCNASSVPTHAHISNQSTGVYLEGTKVTFQCDNVVSNAELTTVCHANGSWIPSPSELDCTASTTSAVTISEITADVKKVLSCSSQVILAAVICCFVFFLLGVLVGVLCYRWGRVFVKPCTSDIKRSNGKRREHPSPTDTPAGDAPVVYEEVATNSHSRQNIELEENVAYGHI